VAGWAFPQIPPGVKAVVVVVVVWTALVASIGLARIPAATVLPMAMVVLAVRAAITGGQAVAREV
jgi:hypothetical protein